MDKIFLSSLSVECIVGIWAWERQIKQTVIIDLEMAADIRRAAATDRIEDTIDYKRVSERMRAFVAESQFQLVETLAERTAAFLLGEFGLGWVRLTVRKPGALAGKAQVGVTIERSAPG
jgi:dihydroneopterin aldolase